METQTETPIEYENVVFRPNAGPQEEFLAAPEREVLYGGAAGGGKSYAILADPMRYMVHPQFSGLILRHTTEELRELIWKSQELYPKIYPGIKWSERKMQWEAPSGARLWMSYLDRDEDVMRYQGLSFSYIAFDELTQWSSPFAWNYMRSRLRSTAPDLPVYMRACVDEGDVLTESGWKNIYDVKEGENVYSVNEDGTLVLKRVTGVHVYDVNENLVKIEKKNLYMSMTPDHRVLYGKDKHKLVKFNEHKGRSIDIVRTAKHYDASGYRSPIASFSDIEYAEFLGLYIAEGCVTGAKRGNYKVLITQNKTENQEWVMKVMKASGYNVCYCKNGDFQITNKALYEHLLPLGKAHQKHFPREFLDNASREQLAIAFEAYARGDGHWQSEKSCTSVTCSRQLSRDLAEIAMKLGFKVQINHKESTNPNHNDRYTVYMTKNTVVTKVDKNVNARNDVRYEHYEGKVCCLSVEDNENFVLMQKGCVWVSGNTTNPGGPGHQWVRKMFIVPSPAGKSFWATDIETGQTLVYPEGHSKAGIPLFKRRFIPAKLSDNPHLAASGDYEAMLLSLPEMQRRQLLEGDWDIADGAAFSEFNRAVHVVEPFDIPHDWTRFRACDYGYGSYSAVLWFAIAPDESLVVYRELYVSKVLAEDLADMVLQLEAGEKIRYGVLDSSCWHRRGDSGPSIAERMILKGCRWRPADRSAGTRVAGKNEIHRRLQIDSFTEKPRMVFFNNCVQTIADLPTLPIDKNNSEDINTKVQNDHTYDALRYGVMSRPRSSSIFDYNPNRTNGMKISDEVFGY
jgi:hypothetical protein